MISKFIKYKQKAIDLRKRGFTYGEIRKNTNNYIQKSTLSCWFKSVNLSYAAKERLRYVTNCNIRNAHKKALKANRERRVVYLNNIKNSVRHLENYKQNKNIAKIMIAMLYLGEGSKTIKGSLLFANSNPDIISLFLNLLRRCYCIDKRKFRVTVQCRADQDTLKLEKFWSKITKISPKQFYKTRIDPRTIGKKSKKPEYKGVCCINYFSADIYNEIKIIMEIMSHKGR